MRVGVLMLPADPWPETVARARRLEALGYHHLWTYDHLSWRRYRDRPWHAAIPWLTGLAGATTTVRLGTMVATPNFRHPATLAKEAMTLDHVSGGRFTLGIGAGGVGFDAEVLGQDVLSAAERGARLAEFVEVVDRLLRNPVSSHQGDYYSVKSAMMLPGCVQQPRLPLAIAAEDRKSLALVARYADAWITHGNPALVEGSAAAAERSARVQADLLAQEAERIGRDPAEIARIYLVGATAEQPLASVAAFTDFIGRYRDLGFTDVVFHHPRPDDPVWSDDPMIVEAIADQVLPLLRR